MLRGPAVHSHDDAGRSHRLADSVVLPLGGVVSLSVSWRGPGDGSYLALSLQWQPAGGRWYFHRFERQGDLPDWWSLDYAHDLAARMRFVLERESGGPGLTQRFDTLLDLATCEIDRGGGLATRPPGLTPPVGPSS